MEHSEWPGPGHTPCMGQEAGPGLPEMHNLLDYCGIKCWLSKGNDAKHAPAPTAHATNKITLITTKGPRLRPLNPL